MKRRCYKYLLMILFSGVLAELIASGTPAGTVIQSRSRVTFTSKSGATIDTVYSAFVSITVLQKAAFNITPADNSLTTLSDSTNADYAAVVTNSGNGNDRSKLSAVSSHGWSTQLFFDGNGDGILQTSESNAGTIVQSSSLAADVPYAVIVRVKVPRGEALNGVKDTTSLIAKSVFDSTISVIGRYVTTIRTPRLDPLNPGLTVNNSNPAAGQQITYSFTLVNNGSVSANGITIQNLLPAGLTFISGTASSGSINGTANPVIWNIGNLAPSQTVTVTVTVQVSSVLNPGAVIANQFGVNYLVALHSYSIGSNTVSITVEGIIRYGVELTPMFTALSREAADTAWYRFKVRNSGSLKELVELSTTSSQNISWKLFRDGNNNGIWDATDQLLTNSNDSAGVDIDSLAVGDSVRVLAMALIPRLDKDLLKDSLQVNATPSGDRSLSVTKLVVTTISIPLISMNKSIFPAGDQPAGTIVSYIIEYANTGSVGVSNFSIIDTSPDATNYVTNSVKVNGISVSDNSQGVAISKDQNNNSVITIAVGTVAPKSTGSVEFKVKIK